MNLPKVFIAVPTRNHAWVLPQYLNGILNLQYPKDLITIYFLVNDTEDDTMAILEEFKEKHAYEYNSISFDEINFGVERDERVHLTRKKLYPHFAFLKNMVKHKFEESDCDFWLQIDTDTIMEPDTLTNLLRHDKGYVCGICNVDKSAKCISINVIDREPGEYKRVEIADIMRTRPGELYRTHWVGGIALIRRDVAEACIYYLKSEKRDDNLGFCTAIRDMGLSAWVDPEVFLEHHMNKRDF